MGVGDWKRGGGGGLLGRGERDPDPGRGRRGGGGGGPRRTTSSARSSLSPPTPRRGAVLLANGGYDAPDHGGVDEASEHGANLPPLAHPRAHRGLPARGCVGAADAGRCGRLPSARAPDRLGRPVARLPPLGAHALGDPVEGRGVARVGQPARRLRGADAPRQAAGGSPRRPPPAPTSPRSPSPRSTCSTTSGRRRSPIGPCAA